MSHRPDVRLVTQIARLYYEGRLTQAEIADKLHVSQVSVSRFLKRAEDYSIVRTTVISPAGASLDLEELVERKFGLRQVLVAEAHRDSEEAVLNAIGTMAAHYLETTVRSGEIIGIPPWSPYLLSMVQQMRPLWKIENCKVVQLLGGVGNPSAEEHANHLTNRLATLVQGEAYFLPAPAIADSASSVRAFAKDSYVQKTINLLDQIRLALLEIGLVEQTGLSLNGGLLTEDLTPIRVKKAVGDICFRFYDASGIKIHESRTDRIVGLTL
jgi:DNA-binding transcriptional regulator LsrR (DeoR family)